MIKLLKGLMLMAQKKTGIPAVNNESKPSTSKPKPKPKPKSLPTPSMNPTPKICLIDTSPDVYQLLTEKLYDCETATLGQYVDTPKRNYDDRSFLSALVSIPSNLHEFQVVVVDLASTDTVSEAEAEVNLKFTSGDSAHALLSSYPEQVFNSKGYGARSLYREADELLNRESLIVVFAKENVDVDYKVVRIQRSGNSIVNQFSYSTLKVCPGISGFRNKSGKKIHARETKLSPVLKKHLDGSSYEVTFDHPKVWNEGSAVLDEKFVPVLENNAGEIVGYFAHVRKGYILVLPQIYRKAEFIVDLFECLAEDLPNIFPYNGMFSWLDDGSYPLPGERELNSERQTIEENYRTAVAKNEAAIRELKDDYKFLRVMLSGTGDELVDAVKDFLNWLDFASVTTMDEHAEDALEEDIQVELMPGILVIEVKGIGGTSKDKECSQISKIKHRRMEARQAFDVSGLYIVNHQRYVSPDHRTNPPFTPNQVKDAELDKRGLVTTYQLYNAYFDISRGLITKEHVRQQLLSFGLVNISPSLEELGVANEVFKSGRVAILQLQDKIIKVGTALYVCKGGTCEARNIISLQVNDVSAEEARSGEVGIELDRPIRKGSTFYLLKSMQGS